LDRTDGSGGSTPPVRHQPCEAGAEEKNSGGFGDGGWLRRGIKPDALVVTEERAIGRPAIAETGLGNDELEEQTRLRVVEVEDLRAGLRKLASAYDIA